MSALPKVSAAVARRALDAALLAAEPAETVTELMRQIATVIYGKNCKGYRVSRVSRTTNVMQ